MYIVTRYHTRYVRYVLHIYNKREISVALVLIFELQLCKRSLLKSQLIVFHPIQIMWFLSYHIVVCQQTL